MIKSTVVSCIKQYDGTFKLQLNNGVRFYSSRQYEIGQELNYTIFMGCVKVN